MLAGVATALAAWSWRKWPDPFIDFGSQLYIPWQLATGKALYWQLEYKHGPLSQYWNALLFLLFGVSLDTLIWANLAVLGVLCGLEYAITVRACDRATATLVVFVQLTVFGFSQYTEIGNYNYVCPYAHEQTHGILLATAMIAALASGRPRAAGLALGGAFLTKSELFVPAAGAAGLGLLLLATAAASRGAWARRIAGPFLIATLVPPALALALLTLQMPFAPALRGVAGNWWHLRGSILDYAFYREGMGLDDPWGNLAHAFRLFLAIAAWVTLASAATWVLRPRRAGVVARTAAGTIAGVGALVALIARPDLVPWLQLGRSLPFTTAVLLAVLVGVCLRRRHEPEALRRFLAPTMWAVMALLLLTKMVLHVRLSHYGFVLAMPATLLLVAALAWGIPTLLATRLGSGMVARALLVAPVLAGVAFFLQLSQMAYARKQLAVGTGSDLIWAGAPAFDPRGEVLVGATTWLRAHMPEGATLLAIPEGLMLNYWLRRPNPTRHIHFEPESLDFAGGEAVVLADIQANPPDFIAVTHRPGTEYGFGYFGVDARYGRQIMNWVRRAYRRVAVIGHEPLADGRFGILLLERIDPTRIAPITPRPSPPPPARPRPRDPSA